MKIGDTVWFISRSCAGSKACSGTLIEGSRRGCRALVAKDNCDHHPYSNDVHDNEADCLRVLLKETCAAVDILAERCMTLKESL